MIEFLKNLLQKVNFKSEDKNLNLINKIIYSIIILCAIVFTGFLIYNVIKLWPEFVDNFRTHWNDSKSFLKGFTK